MAIKTDVTLRRLIYEFSQWAEAHQMVDRFGYGDFLQLYSDSANSYPYLMINCSNDTETDWYIQFQLEICVMDWVFDNRGDELNENQNRVESDTREILRDLTNTIRRSPRWQAFSKYKDASSPTRKFIEKGGDKVSGWCITLNLWVKRKSGFCEIESLLPGYDFGEQGASGCPDATILINGASWGTVSSGGTEDIPVKDTNGASVGSKVGSEWIVPAAGGGSADLEVNGESFGSILAGDTKNLNVHSSTGADVGTKIDNDNLQISDSIILLNGSPLTGLPSQQGKIATIQYANGDPVTVTPVTDTANVFIGTVPNAVDPQVYYNRPWLTQSTSYRNHDEAWRIANPLSNQSAGGNTYNEAIPDSHYLQQVEPDLANGRYDYLKYFNSFGTKFRFSGINGGYYDEADGNYYDVNGVLSDKATEFPDVGSSRWWVYDHLTGYRWPNNDFTFASWNTALDAAATTTTYFGVQPWVVPTGEEAKQLNNNVNETGSLRLNTNRPFFSYAYVRFSTGTTDSNNSANAVVYTYTSYGGLIGGLGKTSTANKNTYFTVFDNGTIPQP